MQGSKGKEAGVGRMNASLWNKLQLSHKELLGSTHWRYFIILTSQAYSHTETSPPSARSSPEILTIAVEFATGDSNLFSRTT